MFIHLQNFSFRQFVVTEISRKKSVTSDNLTKYGMLQKSGSVIHIDSLFNQAG